MQTIDTTSVHLERAREILPVLEDAAARVRTTRGDAFSAVVNGASVTERTQAQAGLCEVAGALQRGRTHRMDITRHPDVIRVGGHSFDARLSYSNGETYLDLDMQGVPNHGVTIELHELRPDGTGVIRRIENAIERLGGSATAKRSDITRYERTLEHARDRLGTPFKYESELHAAKTEMARVIATIAERNRVDPTPPPSAADRRQGDVTVPIRSAISDLGDRTLVVQRDTALPF